MHTCQVVRQSRTRLRVTLCRQAFPSRALWRLVGSLGQGPVGASEGSWIAEQHLSFCAYVQGPQLLLESQWSVGLELSDTWWELLAFRNSWLKGELLHNRGSKTSQWSE